MTEFTPIASTLGGLLIGAAAAILMLALGRIAGISGIVSRLLPPAGEGTGWRSAFLLGLMTAPVAWFVVTGRAVEQTVSGNLPLMVAAGLLVGFGSAVGSGCTSGHGVCGVARLSTRSLVATAVFVSVAAATVFVVRHVLGA
ncbi:MAG: YeeE/YedE family protein [Acetobacterales bacterium]